jgi:hypothetical protein
MSEHLIIDPHPHTPDEIHIIEMLGRFAPNPSAHFNEKMTKAPWIKKGSKGKTRYFSSTKPAHRWFFGIAALMALVVFIGLLISPSIRAVARQIIYSFISEQSDQLDIQATQGSPGDLFIYSEPANFPLTVQEIHEQTGFDLMVITKLSIGLVHVGSRFESSYDAAITLYQGNGYNLFLTQRPIGNGKDVFSIGSSALVDPVMIGDHQGEYVKGGWKAISTQTTTKKISPVNQTDIDAVWDNNLPQYTLRWQADGFTYELRTIGEASPSQLELIVIANELK